ncbi:PREDICTED: uncharacterized protein LOC107161887 isoform X2 [Diuraphis noxia]|uniref:uncharacterized protein LOC107161887 isoform X1 n=1 Tax=Diuraphis noxia TaxID=143948 RepID=UPI0007639E78|nr:PREDICTED: uncharacterized protein LOC107161887 isoform X1 [Diuraphis noxia]XP_015363968.1 PREDICTED: uncharacterized protein LOC107161887 isoform X2 [Diuraphis noxia]
MALFMSMAVWHRVLSKTCLDANGKANFKILYPHNHTRHLDKLLNKWVCKTMSAVNRHAVLKTCRHSEVTQLAHPSSHSSPLSRHPAPAHIIKHNIHNVLKAFNRFSLVQQLTAPPHRCSAGLRNMRIMSCYDVLPTYLFIMVDSPLFCGCGHINTVWYKWFTTSWYIHRLHKTKNYICFI